MTNTTQQVDRPGEAGSLRTWGVWWVFPQNLGFSPLDRLPLHLGRDRQCDVVLDGPSVSRKHASIVRDGRSVVVEDQRSRNGTHLDGAPVARMPLLEGSVLRVGEWLGLVLRDPGGTEIREMAPGLLGGPTLARALEPLRPTRPRKSHVTLVGETGTGKELVARALQTWKGATGPLHVLDCARVRPECAEESLFGDPSSEPYRLGPADGARPGVERTWLLDELSDLPDRAQAQLARALDHSVNAGLQIVVTLRSADRAVSVRPELLHRIAGVRVELPPLRERREDIVALASRFLQDAVSCTEAAQRGVPVGEVGVDVRVYERMLLARWPGNVRQLRMVADRMIADQPTLGPIGPDVFPSDIFAERLPEGRLLSIEEPNPSEAETLRCLLHALRDHSGNVSRAASAVGITRQRAYRLLGSCGNTTLSELRHGNR